jgi:hypothetical protein
MEYLRDHPQEHDRLVRILREVRAQGFVPIPMDRVKQPFDYDRR